MTTALVLGDQLTRQAGPLAAEHDVDPDRVLMVESRAFATRRRYHSQKLTLLFAAMRNFRDALRDDGWTVRYERADTFRQGFERFFADHPDETLVAMEPASHGAGRGLRDAVSTAGGDLELVANETFLCSPEAFDEWHAGAYDDADTYRQEEFYRWMRRRTGFLLTDDGEPEGGSWNYDEQNRETPPADYESPPLPTFDYGEHVGEVREWVEEAVETWGSDEEFGWPVRRGQALDALADFCANRLADFGPYQDAMVGGEWALDHSLLSAAINLGLLHPREVVEAAVETYREREDVPLNSVEGFVRQLLGWREFVRHVYRREMPDLADANQLDHERDLPPLYRDAGATDAACLSEAVGHVEERGYAHHIERLMLLSNFALTYGTDPRELTEWFHRSFVDGFHWVTVPNVVGMGVYASDAFATKPYASSAAYVDRMSDYCDDCPYDPDATTGDDACPFNSLYWDFLDHHEERFRHNHRMAAVYHHWDERDEDERDAVRERAAEVRRAARDGSL
ncbi:cryptochrome/photolyase family protein [Halospeciosus flavus]|uniref:Cryptochrome/photolyase family protein n=1 Tax=Halospeciosus flavus TaxID=3032283 RepID=A0ABD5Z4V6_9EURY|nr:cryptochrome/photolyase family protein [Halospeciosus flavus]